MFVSHALLFEMQASSLCAYISTHIQHWNAYIGDLQEKTFCLNGNISQDECTSDRHEQCTNNCTNKTIGVWMEFYVGKSFVDTPKQDEKATQEKKSPKSEELSKGHLVAALTGSDLKTKISSKNL